MKTAVLVLALVAAVVCLPRQKRHTFGYGPCPKVEPMDSFDWNKFKGKWYVVEKFSTASSCMTLNYEENESGQKKVVQKRQHFLLDTVGVDHAFTYTGQLDVPDLQQAAAMRVKFPLNMIGKADYIVFSTDYDQYAGVYTCQNILFGHRESASILSRTPQLDRMYVNKLRSNLEKSGVDTDDLNLINQEDCVSEEEANFDINIDADTFSSENIADVVRKAGDKLGDGIEVAADVASDVYDRVSGTYQQAKDLYNGQLPWAQPDSEETDTTEDAEWIS